ncbi:hypothetical protein SAMN04489867_1495 [Pedococcus dokdonensis]|uniref:Uncharacterized protein n=1 Tax=Pedococcus dokdonensis TaxID=443156 RepID=A0A1H0Q5N9_9MICO|nr:hypothetical protein [Pedococcus dokdonensis]SDP12721.1 hypothetical protein SAMN04489867_1495 [Pedococcus dokdonensis]
MNAQQTTHRTTRNVTATRRTWGVVATTALVVALGTLPAAAKQDPGQIDQPTTPNVAIYFHPLERVGTQYVAGDNLTGNGVPAPRWVPEVR